MRDCLKGLVDGDLVPDEAALREQCCGLRRMPVLMAWYITSLSMPRERTEPEGRLELVGGPRGGSESQRRFDQKSEFRQRIDSASESDGDSDDLDPTVPRRDAHIGATGAKSGATDLRNSVSAAQKHIDVRGAGTELSLNPIPITDDPGRSIETSVNVAPEVGKRFNVPEDAVVATHAC